MSQKKIETSGGSDFGQNPFGALDGTFLPPGPLPKPTPQGSSRRGAEPANRGRVDILREKAGRGGKTVTVVTGFVGIGMPEKETLAKKMQKACGAGGTVKEGRIEIQGDNRDAISKILIEAGFRPVFAGG